LASAVRARPTLFERAPALRTGGYIIDFWGLGFEIASRMELTSTLLERCYLMERRSMVDAHGREQAGLAVRGIRDRLQGHFVSVARADLAAALFHACDGVPAHVGVSIEDIEDVRDGVLVTLPDGRVGNSTSS
jgi:hypothetical protein